MSGGNYKKHSWSRFQNCKGFVQGVPSPSELDPNTKVYWCPKRSSWSLMKCNCQKDGIGI